jgi:hypothetical protein
MTAIQWPADRRDRFNLAAALVVFQLVVIETAAFLVFFLPAHSGWQLGMDFDFYVDQAERWLTTGQWYLPHQLAGPYVVESMLDNLYPPTALLLFLPFVWLPAVLWWVAPAAVLVYVIRGWRPKPLALFAMSVLMLYPPSIFAWLLGNTTIWTAAILAAGLRWGWPMALLVMKPSLAFLGIAMLPLWLDYVTAMRNATLAADWSIRNIPLMLVPVAAWVGRRRQPMGMGW